MKAALYNRVLIVLGFLGIFFAGTLSLEKLLDLSLPCGPSGGCNAVATHPSSMFLGIPTAVFGLFAYLLLTVAALLRQDGPLERTKKLATLGFVVALAGTLVSLALQVYSFSVIKAFCPWCFGSACTMTLTLIFSALLNLQLENREEPLPRSGSIGIVLPLVLTLVLVGGMAFTVNAAKAAGERIVRIDESKIEKVDLVPKDAHILGDKNAPVTVIEFSDICCPTCQSEFPKMKEFVEGHPGKIRLVHRHFNIPQHQFGPLAAAIAEYAGEKGRFWDYLLSAMAGADHKVIEDPAILWGAAKSIGLDENDIKKRLSNENDPIYDRIANDKSTANVLGVSGTPTFLLQLPGQRPKAMTSKDLWKRLQDPSVIPVDGKPKS